MHLWTLRQWGVEGQRGTRNPELGTLDGSMLKTLVTKVFGDRHEREARKLWPIVDEINAIVERLATLSEDELRGQTARLRGIVQERTRVREERLAELRDTKRRSEDAAEREQLTVAIREEEDALKAELEAVLDDLQIGRAHV